MDNRGFTLIEILVALALTGIVMTGLVIAFNGQQEAHLYQNQVVEMQQNLRVATLIMARQIRLAGYDPDGTNGAGIMSAGDGSDASNLLQFFYYVADGETDGANNDNDGDTDEAGEVLQLMEFYLYDSLGDGSMDLGQRNGSQLSAIAENIQSLQFQYLDGSGAVMTTPITGTALENIRFVRITLVAEADPGQTDYTGGKTRTLTTTVLCRNMGI